jgi:hypothetical protein
MGSKVSSNNLPVKNIVRNVIFKNNTTNCLDDSTTDNTINIHPDYILENEKYCGNYTFYNPETAKCEPFFDSITILDNLVKNSFNNYLVGPDNKIIYNEDIPVNTNLKIRDLQYGSGMVNWYVRGQYNCEGYKKLKVGDICEDNSKCLDGKCLDGTCNTGGICVSAYEYGNPIQDNKEILVEFPGTRYKCQTIPEIINNKLSFVNETEFTTNFGCYQDNGYVGDNVVNCVKSSDELGLSNRDKSKECLPNLWKWVPIEIDNNFTGYYQTDISTGTDSIKYCPSNKDCEIETINPMYITDCKCSSCYYIIGKSHLSDPYSSLYDPSKEDIVYDYVCDNCECEYTEDEPIKEQHINCTGLRHNMNKTLCNNCNEYVLNDGCFWHDGDHCPGNTGSLPECQFGSGISRVCCPFDTFIDTGSNDPGFTVSKEENPSHSWNQERWNYCSTLLNQGCSWNGDPKGNPRGSGDGGCSSGNLEIKECKREFDGFLRFDTELCCPETVTSGLQPTLTVFPDKPLPSDSIPNGKIVCKNTNNPCTNCYGLNSKIYNLEFTNDGGNPIKCEKCDMDDVVCTVYNTNPSQEGLTVSYN